MDKWIVGYFLQAHSRQLGYYVETEVLHQEWIGVVGLGKNC